MQDAPDAEPDDAGGADRDQHLHDALESRFEPDGPHALLQAPLVEVAEAGVLVRLPTEGLHHDDCVEDLGEERRHPAVALALEPDGLPQLVREAEGGERHQREHREAGRGQLPVHDEHHREHAEDDEHLAQDDEHAVDQHLAQHVRVARRPQHEVAGAMGVVDGEREPLQVREVAPADGEGEAAGVLLRPGADQLAGQADEPGDERAFTVIAPVEVARPVPVVGLVRGQVQRAGVGQEGDVPDRRRDDQQGGDGVAERITRGGPDGHQHESVLHDRTSGRVAGRD